MRTPFILSVAIAALCAGAMPCAASVVISNAATQNMTCSAGTCAPTAADAVLNVQDLEALLASGNATVTTTGSGVQARNIVLDAGLEWSTSGALTLDAFQSVRLNRLLSVDGDGAVSIATNDGGSGGEFWCGDKGSLQFNNLSDALTINSTVYTLVSSVAALASAIAVNPTGAFALANSYNAADDGTYASPPVATVFSGTFNGLGNTISNLSINDPTEDNYVGLFATIATGATLANIRLVNENVQGGSGSSIETSKEFIGGLVGYSTGGTIAYSFSSGAISGGDYAVVGGLIGISGSTIRGAGSEAAVSVGSIGDAGGLIGDAPGGAIVDSYATGSVSSGTGYGFIGGLVGFNSHPDVTHSWASGQVTGNSTSTTVGGLVGVDQYGVISRSHASGEVSCQQVCGGLLGWAGSGGGYSKPTVSESYATGNVTGSITNSLVGGLVGYNEVGEVSNSYATGVDAGEFAGGLVGENEASNAPHSIRDSYATGTVSGSEYAGGVIGYDLQQFASPITHVYWDMTTSGITDPSQGAGNVSNDPGLRGLSDKKLRSALPSGFSSRIWTQNANLNGGRPYLIANPPAN